MKILVVGKGGREHALVTALSESPSAPELFCFPGSDAIFQRAKPTPAHDLSSLIAFMKAQSVDLCVAGEESYLVTGEGLANACAAAGIPCWGPPRESAQLEASKEFAKAFLVRHGIPTASHAMAGSLPEAQALLTRFPVVLKFDGLAAGKGVAVCQSRQEAEEFLHAVFVQRQFGEGRVVVEECLTGPEVSIFASIVDSDYQILCPARDYKRIGDGDEGPNTGGMGAVASRHLVEAPLLAEIEQTIVQPTVAGLQKDRLPYRGFLYFGLMLTPSGPKVLEYNCRFGDPECEAVMPLAGGDLAAYCLEGARGVLRRDLLSFDGGWSVCVILASAGYPVTSRSGDVISGLEAVEAARVYHCGTRKDAAGQFTTNGGRVLAVVAQGTTRQAARDKAYAAAEKLSFAGCQRRTDIATLHFS
ncbi:MAG: phosphoribosylamine--glycine ligase [Verrucomicrobiales bacterium]|nr:phosphoribosylamine--glycine ligase [Verrucomicrobiales bacterium]